MFPPLYTNSAEPATRGEFTRNVIDDAQGLIVRDLIVIRNDRLVLDGVSFALAPGAALMLTGPNGAGKSTLLRVLAGLRRADSGTILWNGAPVTDPVAQGTLVAYLGHRDALKPGLTLRENLSLASEAFGQSPDAAIAALGLAELADLPARMLSAGQSRRAALARTILRQSPLWLLDEPSLGLDTASIARLGDVLAAHRAQGGIVIATTHVDLPLPGCETLALRAPDFTKTVPGGLAAPDAARPPEDWF